MKRWSFVLVLFLCLGRGWSDPLSEEGLALLAMKASFTDPVKHLENWKLNGTATPCLWSGIACNNMSSVVGLYLAHMNLTGTLSADLGRLKNLVTISLEFNNFTGLLPVEVTTLLKVQYFNISNNNFNGAFPAKFSQLQSLQVLDCFNNNFSGALPGDLWLIPTLEHLSLGGNYFEGSIPAQYGSFPALKYLGLNGNSLTGPIPPELGKLQGLQELYMGYYNNYSSGIPASFGNLASLVRLDMGRCGLTGSIPPELGKLGKLDTLFLQLNNLVGVIPVQIGNIVNLQSLDLSYNNLSGIIPPALIYLQKLELLSLMSNRFEGTIPDFIGDMPNLQVLYLWENQLTGPIPSALGQNMNLTLLDLSSNFLNGTIPNDLCAGQKLEWVILKDNQLTGPIPEALGNCISLSKLRLSNNRLNGSIPLGLLGLPNISMVEIQMNQVMGPIPSEIIDSPQLSYLDFSDNNLSSKLPESIGNLPMLQSFLISNNHFEGPIPPQICDMQSLNKLDISGNEFTGTIPVEMSNCKKLGSLDLSRNGLTGQIPPQVEYIPDLYLLNLSHNQLSGQIPPQLQLLQTLNVFDFSYNNLSGPIPHFDSYNLSSFEGNPFLCGGLLQPCPAGTYDNDGAPAPGGHHSRRHKAANLLAWLVGALFSAALVVLLVGMCCFFKKYRWYICKYFRRESTTRPWKLTAFSRLDLTASQVLDCLDEENIIGRGGAGTVYKGVMSTGQVVAVKRLAGEGKGAAHDHGFSAEIQTLGKIRHRNIVRLLGCCSNHETNLLIYEYMPNGSLGELLHSKERSEKLDWETRYNIAVQAAHGLCYLHHDCSPLIVHRDVKSNNILLDSTFQAHVADFGLAKLFQDTGKSESMSSIAGSYGYIAPEYAYTLKVNEKSDIYSFGVVLMELLTGKKPIETEFGDGVDIVQWVRRKIQTKDGVLDVLDPRMGGVGVPLQEVMLVLRVALLCSSDLPVDRPTMRDVVQMLSDVKPKSKSSTDSRELAAPDAFKPQDLRLVCV
uniref:non-specific serine/threonine protein kinase n=1 Tax=Pohlia nutans TaxID=140635 RepID=A0A1P8DYU1_9BRYO|nr:leucine-rich repeat receptor-like protein kinase [Pohlia nutans]